MNLENVPKVGDRVRLTTGHEFIVKRRTKNQEGHVFLFDGETPYPIEMLLPEPDKTTVGDRVIRRFAECDCTQKKWKCRHPGGKRQVEGWVGEVLRITGDQFEVVLIPDKWWDKNAPTFLWPIKDCIPKEKR